MRIRGAKTELEEAGLETEGMVESTAKLRSEILALSGVDIMENNNEFKSTYKIMDELAAKWEDLTDIQQATITELIAGKRQSNIVSSVMTNFDTAREALDTSLNSSGSALEEHEKWQKSLEAQILKLKASWQSLSQTFLSSDFLKGALDAVIGLVNGLDKLIDSVGVLPLLATAFASYQSFSGKGFFKVITDEATGAATGVENVFTNAFNKIKGIMSSVKLKETFTFDSSFTQSLAGDEVALMKYKLALDSGMSKQEAFNATMQGASPAAQQFAKTMDVTGDSVRKFSENQKMSQISLQAQDKSFANCNSLINSYNNSMATCGLTQQQFAQSVKQSNPALYQYLSGLNGAQGSMKGYIGSLIGAKVATVALKVATMALNAVIGMGIGALISLVISGITKWINAEEELAEKVEEVTSKFKQQHEELQKLRGDYDASNEKSMISRYEKLAKGVNHLGENVSLTADEYSEYQSIVNTIAEQIPSLVSGYDEQGNALLNVKGNVEELTAAYEKLIKAQNNEVLKNVKDIEKDFNNSVEEAGSVYKDFLGLGAWIKLPTGNMSLEGAEIYREVLNSEDAVSAFENSKSKFTQTFDDSFYNLNNKALSDALEDRGYERQGGFLNKESPEEHIKRVLEEDKDAVKDVIDNFYADLEAQTEGMQSIAEATLSNAFDIGGSDYYDMSDTMKNVARQIVNGFDYDFFAELQEKGVGVDTYINDMLDQLNAIDATSIEASFDLQTQFNGGEIPYGEYVRGLESTGKTIDQLVSSGQLDKDIGTQIKLSIGLNEDGLVDEYDRLKKRLAEEDYFNTMPSQTKPFLDSLSAEEVSVLWKVIPELEATDYKENIADIKSALELEMMLQGLNFDLNIEVEAAGLEALNTALAESVSATGLSTESISALKSRYADLESQGYDLSSMFEETSTGIRINRQEFNKLESAYATDKLAEVDGELDEMKLTYDDLGEAIKNCDDPVRKSELYNDRQTLAKRISEAATLAAQYEGLTNAYNDWLGAEEAGQERDMYENVIKGFETVDDEISRGWIDDGAIEFLELLTGRTDLAGKSGKQLKEIYDGLDGTIKNTTYSIRDFFTVDDEGNSTNAGVYNFLDAIGQLEEEEFDGKDVVKRDKDGNIIGFDFELAGGDEVVAEALGVSEELVQIMVRAADDAGFVVSMDGTYKQLADLQNEAKASADYLKSIGKTEFEFDFNTDNIDSLVVQLDEAHKVLDDPDFWNQDGTFNFNADGATEAMQVVSTLQAKLDKLTEDRYGIGLTVEDEEFEEPLENLQEYGRKVATLNQLELNPKANSEEIKELEGELDDIAEYFANLDDDLKVQLGFEADDNIEEVKKKIESGEVTIPTVLDIQANMDKNIETLADLALLNSGLLSESQEETIRKKYNVEVEADEVDTSDVDDKVDDAIDWNDGLNSMAIGIIAEVFGEDDVEGLKSKLEKLDDKTIQAIAKVLGQIDVDKLRNAVGKLKGNEVEAIAKAIGEGDVEGLKTAISQLDPKTVQAIAEAFGYDDVNGLIGAIDDLDPKTVKAVAEALGITDVDSLKGAIDKLDDKTVKAVATTSGQTEVDNLRNSVNALDDKTITVTTVMQTIKKVVSAGVAAGKKVLNNRFGLGEANGTANVNGTTGRAFKQGSWGTKNSGTALVGELGMETLVRQGHFYTIGDNGAEFIKYKQGDIIFNHKICGIA